MTKPKVLKDYDTLDVAIQEQIKLFYPEGFEQSLIKFQNKEGKYISALPFETDEKYYLIRMSVLEAQEIIDEDDDYDNEGNLKDDIREEYEDRYDED